MVGLVRSRPRMRTPPFHEFDQSMQCVVGETASELGDRYEQLRQAIIGFRAHVVTTNAKFKLGQNEKPEVFNDYVAALASNGNKPLADWMERYGRLR